MSNQENNVYPPPYKIVFSNIYCKLNVSEQALFGFVVRLGKHSSKYSNKKQIINGILEIDNVLQVPFDQKLLVNQGPRKQKCEIMLYKFRESQQKSSKELIGMASIAMTNQIFNEYVKKLRLTNSFDKEAFVQCKLKIQLGEADTLSLSESRMSSIQIKSLNQTLSQIQKQQFKQPKTVQKKRDVRIGLVTSNSHKSLSVASQSMKSDSSFLQIFNLHKPQQITKQEKQSQSKSQTQYVSTAKNTFGSEEMLNFHKQIEDQKNNNLVEICNNLQKQNIFLLNKIQNLQTQLLTQSTVSNKSNINNPQIPRPAGSIKKSPMIKKNAAITVTPSFQKSNQAEQIQFQESNNQVKQNKLITQKSAGSLHSYKKSQFKMNLTKEIDQELSPYFANKNMVFDTSNLQEQNQLNSHMTFAGQRFHPRSQKLSISPVIGVMYTPSNFPYQGRHQTSYYQRENSIMNHSVSEAERKKSGSYSKFSGKKKYQVIGAIKSPSQSQNHSYFQHESQQFGDKKGGSFIISKPPLKPQKFEQSSFNQKTQKQDQFGSILKNNIISPKGNNQNFILDLLNLNEKEENVNLPIIKNAVQSVFVPAENTISNIFNNNSYKVNGEIKARVTLEQLDIKTEERFRKNERALKLANNKILDQNIILKREKKYLEQQIELKKDLSHEQFENLKQRIAKLTKKIEDDKRSKEENESKLKQIIKNVSTLQQQNSRLKKQLKQQKNKYEYYLKIGNINDHKEKQKQPNKAIESAIKSKRTSIKYDSQIINSAQPNKSSTKNLLNITSIMNINNKENPYKAKGLFESRSLKKVDFTLENKSENEIKMAESYLQAQKKNQKPLKPDVPRPSSSLAVSKLKEHLKTGASRVQKGYESMLNSPKNNESFLNGFKGGFTGTGQTIINGGENHHSTYIQK